MSYVILYTIGPFWVNVGSSLLQIHTRVKQSVSYFFKLVKIDFIHVFTFWTISQIVCTLCCVPPAEATHCKEVVNLNITHSLNVTRPARACHSYITWRRLLKFARDLIYVNYARARYADTTLPHTSYTTSHAILTLTHFTIGTIAKLLTHQTTVISDTAVIAKQKM